MQSIPDNMLRQHPIPYIAQTTVGKFRLLEPGMSAVSSVSSTPTSNLSIYLPVRSFRNSEKTAHFHFDFSGERAVLASCTEKGGKPGNPMPSRFPSDYPQRFNILSGGHSLNAPRVHRADTVQGSPTRVPRFLRIVTIIRGPEFSQNLIGEQVQNRVPEDSLGSLIRKDGSAGLLFLQLKRSNRRDNLLSCGSSCLPAIDSDQTLPHIRPYTKRIGRYPARIRVNRTGAAFRKSWHNIHRRNDHPCGAADLFIRSSGKCAAPASFTRPISELRLHSFTNKSAEFFAVEQARERAGINTTAATMPLCSRPFFSIEWCKVRRQWARTGERSAANTYGSGATNGRRAPFYRFTNRS